MITELQQQKAISWARPLAVLSAITILIVAITLLHNNFWHFLFYGYLLVSTAVNITLIGYIGLVSKNNNALATGALMSSLMLIVQFCISYHLYILLF